MSTHLARTTGLLVAIASSIAAAQTDGVVFVDDLEKEAMRAAAAKAQQPQQARQTGFPLAYQAKAPSEQSRFPQPTVQGLPRVETPQPKGQGWSATLGLKKTLSGLFGGTDQQQTKGPAASKNQLPQMWSGGETQYYPPSTPVAASKGKQVVNVDSKRVDRQVSRTGGIQQRPSTMPGPRRGLLGLWGSESNREQQPTEPTRTLAIAKSRTPSPVLPNLGKTDRPQATTRPQPAAPPQAGEGVVAMVTDQEPPKAPAAELPSLQSDPRLKAAFNQPIGQSRNQQPTVKLPTVTTPPVSSDRPQGTVQGTVARALAKQTPKDAKIIPAAGVSPAVTGATGEPKEIMNQHAVAVANRPASRTKAPQAMKVRPQASPLREQASKSTVATMPKNPVAPTKPKPAEPSAKSVELLAEANRLASSAEAEEDYTAVVQACRHVLAIESAPLATDYCNDLASWALNRRGEIKSDQGRVKEALLDFNDALRLDPERYRAIHNRGVLAAQAGRYADAFDDFNRTVELNPHFAKAFSNRGALYVQAGQLEKASTDYRQAITLDPDLAVAHKGRGRVCHLLGQFELALQHMDAAARLAPEDARIVSNRGDLLSDMGRYRSAMANYQKAIELAPAYAEAHRNLAWLQATCPDKEVRNAAEAMAGAKQAMELCSEPTDLEYDTLAAAHAATGDFDTAGSLMEKVVELAPEKDKANYLWRKQLYERGQPYVTEPASNVQQVSYAE